jgi:hypothetical protein
LFAVRSAGAGGPHAGSEHVTETVTEGDAMTDITTTSSPAGAGRGQGPGGTSGDQGTAQQAKDEAANVAGRAKDEAANVAGTAKEQAGAVAATAVDEAKQLGSEAADQAKQVLTDARDQLRAKAAEESQRLGATIGDLGQQLRTMADAGQPGLARDLVQQAAGQVQQMAQRMEQGGLERMLSDARRVARNRPGTFLLGAAAAGFVAARVARSADTTALKEAATPDHGNGANGHGNGYGDGLAWNDEATQPRPTPQSQGTAQTATMPAVTTQTATMSAVEGPQ